MCAKLLLENQAGQAAWIRVVKALLQANKNLQEDEINMKTYSELLSTLHTDATSATLELTADWMQGRTAYGGWQAALAVLAATVLGLAAQHPAGAARFCLLDSSPDGTPAAERLADLAGAVPQPMRRAAGREAGEVIEDDGESFNKIVEFLDNLKVI